MKQFYCSLCMPVPKVTKITCHGKGSHTFRQAELSKHNQKGQPVRSNTFCANHFSMFNQHGIAYDKGSRKGCPACDKRKTIEEKAATSKTPGSNHNTPPRAKPRWSERDTEGSSPHCRQQQTTGTPRCFAHCQRIDPSISCATASPFCAPHYTSNDNVVSSWRSRLATVLALCSWERPFQALCSCRAQQSKRVST